MRRTGGCSCDHRGDQNYAKHLRSFRETIAGIKITEEVDLCRSARNLKAAPAGACRFGGLRGKTLLNGSRAMPQVRRVGRGAQRRGAAAALASVRRTQGLVMLVPHGSSLRMPYSNALARGRRGENCVTCCGITVKFIKRFRSGAKGPNKGHPAAIKLGGKQTADAHTIT